MTSMCCARRSTGRGWRRRAARRGVSGRLRDLEDAPVLFVAGGIARLEALAGGDLEQGPRAAAIVGTRRASPDGLEVARALGRGMGRRV